MSAEGLKEAIQFNRVQTSAPLGNIGAANASSGGCDASCSGSSGSGCDNSNFTAPEPKAKIVFQPKVK